MTKPIRKYRDLKHLILEEFGTQQQFADVIGVSRNQVNRFLMRNPNNFKVKHIRRMAKNGVTPSDFFDAIQGEGIE